MADAGPGAIWSILTQLAEDGGKLHVVASCRYRNTDFRPKHLMPVPPLPPDALFRLMGWFDGLRRLSTRARARLVERLAGHPRAVEYADDLIQKALDDWEDTHGPWRLPDPPTTADLARELWKLVKPALPRVKAQLWDNLLLAALWDRVLDDRARRMLFRMTLLRRPWEWDLVRELGEEGEPPGQTEATANRLRRTSLLEQVDLLRETGLVRHFTIHPATAQFVARRFGADPRCGWPPTSAWGPTTKLGCRRRRTSSTSSRPAITCSRRENTIGRADFFNRCRIAWKSMAAFARGCTFWSPSWPSPSWRR